MSDINEFTNHQVLSAGDIYSLKGSLPDSETSSKQELSLFELESKAELEAREEFPNEEDKSYRDFSKRERLSSWGLGPKLDRHHLADLHSKREFPTIKYFRELARQELLACFGLAPKLTIDQQYDISLARSSGFVYEERAKLNLKI